MRSACFLNTPLQKTIKHFKAVYKQGHDSIRPSPAKLIRTVHISGINRNIRLSERSNCSEKVNLCLKLTERDIVCNATFGLKVIVIFVQQDKINLKASVFKHQSCYPGGFCLDILEIVRSWSQRQNKGFFCNKINMAANAAGQNRNFK